MDLFGTDIKIKIRTLGYYQPFGSLMLHGKVETRWVKIGKKPTFPVGEYVFYTTKIAVNGLRLMDWCGSEIIDTIVEQLRGEETTQLNGYAIAKGELVNIRHMVKEDEAKAFVKFKGIQYFDGVPKRQWCLEFKNVSKITPFKYDYGKQGVGILPQILRDKFNNQTT